MKVIGYQRKVYDFDKNGQHVHTEGLQLYLSYELRNGVGVGCESVYINDSKLAGYVPSIGDEVEVTYNRFGKVQGIKLI